MELNHDAIAKFLAGDEGKKENPFTPIYELYAQALEAGFDEERAYDLTKSAFLSLLMGAMAAKNAKETGGEQE